MSLYCILNLLLYSIPILARTTNGTISEHDSSIFTFIQISDTHISRKYSSMTNVHFRLFTSTILPEFNPQFVIHTGDITDGWKKGVTSGEIEEEWMMYRSSLVSSGYYNKTVWMDVRGNHDNTNQNSTRQHYYYQYGTCRDEERVYNRIIRHSFGNYCFIGVDATLSPSPGCIMTYFGYVPRPDQQKLKHFLKEDEDICNHTVVFMHYPTLYANSPALHSIYRDHPPSFVLAGHVHATLGERANTRLNDNTIELVVKDFKRKLIFRLFAFDNDYLSYTDVNLDEALMKPILLLTNPPNSQLISPKQRLDYLYQTEFIHVFVFDVSHNGEVDVDGFSVQINGVQLHSNITVSPTNNHLFYISWDPTLYGKGLHTITIEYDNGYHVASVTQSFLTSYQTTADVSSTNSSVSFISVLTSMNPGAFTGSLFLKSTFVPVIITLSYTGSLLLVIIVVIARMTIKHLFPYPLDSSFAGRVRVWRYLEQQKDLQIPSIVRSVLLMASDPYVSTYFIASLLWMIFGFWSIGTYPDEFGIQTLWGMVFIPATTTGSYSLWLDLYVWAILYLFGFFVPLFAYYCAIMSPSPLLQTPSPWRWARGFFHGCGLLLFVGIFFVIKMFILHGNMEWKTLWTSPVHVVMILVNAVLLVREILFDTWYSSGGKKEGDYDAFETVAVHSKMSHVCCNHLNKE